MEQAAVDIKELSYSFGPSQPPAVQGAIKDG